MSIEPSLKFYPQGRKAEFAYSQLPTDGTGDFTVARNTICQEINKDGDSVDVAANKPRFDFRGDYTPQTDNSYYSFDGINDYIEVADSNNVNFGTGDFTITNKTNRTSGDLDWIFNKRRNSSNYVQFYWNSDNTIYFIVRVGSTTLANYNSSMPITTEGDVELTLTAERVTQTVTLYINNDVIPLGAVTTLSTSSLSNLANVTYNYDNVSTYSSNKLYKTFLDNYALTAQQVEDRYNGEPIPEEYKGASNTDFTAGAFIIGKSYKIATVGTTDFTLIGSADNVVGTKFIATGVGTGTGTATNIGNALNLSIGKTGAIWYDREHPIQGTVNGAALVNGTDFGDNHYTVNNCPYLFVEPEFTNYFLNSETPVTQTITTVVGTTYTVNCKGAGEIIIEEVGSTGIGGTATEVYSFTYTATTTSVTITLSAGNSFDFVQMSDTDYEMNHVPTLGSSVTKFAEEIYNTSLGSVIGQTEGTIYVEAYVNGVDLGNNRISLSDGTNSEWIFLAVQEFTGGVNGALPRVYIASGGGIVSAYATSQGSGLHKYAITYKVGEAKFFIDGVLVSTLAPANIPNCSVLNITGSSPTLTETDNTVRYKAIQIYDTVLSDDELQSLTTL